MEGLVRENVTRVFRATALLSLASVVVGLGNFGFNILVARQGGAAAYGAVAPLLAVAAVTTVLTTAITFTVARMVVAANPEPRRALRRSVRAVIPWLALAAALLSFAQPLAAYLRLESSALVAVAVLFGAASLSSGAPLGVLLGMRRYGLMAAILLVMPVTRVVAFELLSNIQPVTDAALVGSVVGACSVLVVAVISVFAVQRHTADSGAPFTGSLARESVIGSLLAGCLWVGWVAPVVVARHVLSPALAGDFAAVQLMSTAVIYVTSPVIAVFFPLIAHDPTVLRARTGLAVTSGIGGVSALGLALLGSTLAARLYGPSFAPPQILFWTLGASALCVALATYGLWAARAAQRFTPIAAAVVVCSMLAELAVVVAVGREGLALAALPAAGLAAGVLVVGVGVVAHHQSRHQRGGYSHACVACLALRP